MAAALLDHARRENRMRFLAARSSCSIFSNVSIEFIRVFLQGIQVHLSFIR
jgi:hypothetical protein